MGRLVGRWSFEPNGGFLVARRWFEGMPSSMFRRGPFDIYVSIYYILVLQVPIANTYPSKTQAEPRKGREGERGSGTLALFDPRDNPLILPIPYVYPAPPRTSAALFLLYVGMPDM